MALAGGLLLTYSGLVAGAIGIDVVFIMLIMQIAKRKNLFKNHKKYKMTIFALKVVFFLFLVYNMQYKK